MYIEEHPRGFTALIYRRGHEKTSYVSKAKLCKGMKKFTNDKFELKVDFESIIMCNTSKIMICYLFLTIIIKSNMIFMHFWHIGARADGQNGLIGQKPRAPLLFRTAFWNI